MCESVFIFKRWRDSLKILKMIKSSLISIFIIFIFSCHSEVQKLKDEKVFHLSEYFSKFKYHDLTEFKIDTFDLTSELLKIDSSDLKKIGQDSMEYFMHDSYYYYSTFQDTSIISIFQESDEESSNLIWLLKYDELGKLKNKKIIVMEGGDAGDYWHLKSKLISPNNWVDTFYVSSQDLDTDEMEEDSIVTKFSFSQNFSIKTDTILNRHFKGKY